jgi:hypothetical protein
MGEQVRFKDYFKHLKEEHDVQGFPMNSATLTMSEYSNSIASGMYIVVIFKVCYITYISLFGLIFFRWTMANVLFSV